MPRVHQRHVSWKPGLAALGLLFTVSCNGNGKGTITVVTACTAGCDTVTQETVTVSAGGGSSFTPIVEQLSPFGDEWTARVADIPAGPSRQFDVVAYDGSGAKVAAGSATSDVLANSEGILFISLTTSGQPPPSGPVIDSISALPSTVAPGGTVLLLVSAHDTTPGVTLSYLWSATCGSFDNITLTSPKWTAPTYVGTCQVTVTVTDSNAASASASITITVSVGTGSATVNVDINNSPTIVSLTAQVTLGPTTVGNVQLVAFDADGDSLSYTWTSTCPGLMFNFAPPYSQTNPQFTAPQPMTFCAINVTVEDGHGGETSGSLTISPG